MARRARPRAHGWKARALGPRASTARRPAAAQVWQSAPFVSALVVGGGAIAGNSGVTTEFGRRVFSMLIRPISGKLFLSEVM